MSGVVFSPDGSRIATSTLGGEVRLWDVTTGRACGGPLRDELKNETWFSGSLAFSPDSKLLAGWSPNGQVGLWDCATGKPHGPRLSHADFVIHVAFSPDGTTLATGSRDATARLWDVKTGDAGWSAVAARGFDPRHGVQSRRHTSGNGIRV